MSELHLKVYTDRSELAHPDGTTELFTEGPASEQARIRYRNITQQLEAGFLVRQITLCKEKPDTLEVATLAPAHTALLDALVHSMTSEVGRALISLTVLQLSVKAIEPEQSIRLHKAGNSRRDFSWREGISMRTLDAEYITKALRTYDLLKMNKYGFMMTRSLAENYPYSKVYKAAMRGARTEWALIVEALETGELMPLPALQYLLSQLINNADQFRDLAETTLSSLQQHIAGNRFNTRGAVLRLLEGHIEQSNYAARIMEIGMHALMQAMKETGAIGSDTVKPLSQMRSANKKHGNVGDVELLNGSSIVEAWDAKYGKTYLRDELEELNDKLPFHASIDTAGFVTSEASALSDELQARIEEIAETQGVDLHILTLEAWVDRQYARALEGHITDEITLSRAWMSAYAEAIAQRRPQIAPIDEPCFQWLQTLNTLLRTMNTQ